MAYAGFNKGMTKLTTATMLQGQASYLSMDRSCWDGPALCTSPGAQAERMSLLHPFMAHVS